MVLHSCRQFCERGAADSLYRKASCTAPVVLRDLQVEAVILSVLSLSCLRLKISRTQPGCGIVPLPLLLLALLPRLLCIQLGTSETALEYVASASQALCLAPSHGHRDEHRSGKRLFCTCDGAIDTPLACNLHEPAMR